jgi:precorrin-3B synthase
MVAAGLADADPAREARRRVTCLPNGDSALAESVEAALRASAMPLAEKFDVLVGRDDAPDADIMLHQGTLWVAGAQAAARTDTPAADVVALANMLAGQRMQPLTARLGAAAIFREVGLAADAPIPPAVPAASAVGVLFGRLTVPGLVALATLGTRYGNGIWKTTRQRALALGGVTDASGFAAAAAMFGFILAPNDARRRASACPGRGECAAGVTDTRRDVLTLLPHLPAGATLHVSGCTKGCAHPAPADFTFVGTASGYDLVRRGRTNDPPVAQRLSLAAAGALMRAS